METITANKPFFKAFETSTLGFKSKAEKAKEKTEEEQKPPTSAKGQLTGIDLVVYKAKVYLITEMTGEIRRSTNKETLKEYARIDLKGSKPPAKEFTTNMELFTQLKELHKANGIYVTFTLNDGKERFKADALSIELDESVTPARQTMLFLVHQNRTLRSASIAESRKASRRQPLAEIGEEGEEGTDGIKTPTEESWKDLM